MTLTELIRRPELDYDKLAPIDHERPELPEEVREQVNILIKYDGYISRQIKQVESFKKLEKKKMEVIGVYSPVGRTMKTTFALTLGQILAKKRACLYLNLEACSGFEYLLERSFDQTLGDLLYYQRLGSEQLITKMGSIVQSVNNLDYLPPVLSMEDIQSTTAQEWISLLQQIIDYSNYDVVILDLSDSVSQLYKVPVSYTHLTLPTICSV